LSERWTLFTNHGHVLFFLAATPDATIRQVAESIGISERRVAGILRDLEAAEMVSSTRVGIRKHYEVNQDAHFRHPTLNHVPLRDVLGKLRVRGDAAFSPSRR
jgi:DNA-binding transcriptional regulator GbsR (MarR family)